MAELDSVRWQELRRRYRGHLAQARAIIDRHTAIALAAAGGSMRKAVRILADQAATDPELARELDALEDLNVQLGWIPSKRQSPSANPRRKQKKRKSHAQS